MQSLTVEGHPLLDQEISYQIRKFLSNDIARLGMGNVRHGTVPGESRDSPQYPCYRRRSLTKEQIPLL